MLDNEQPLGLAKGSVRAILALIITALVAADLIPVEAGFMAWGFYFGSRASNGQA